MGFRKLFAEYGGKLAKCNTTRAAVALRVHSIPGLIDVLYNNYTHHRLILKPFVRGALATIYEAVAADAPLPVLEGEATTKAVSVVHAHIAHTVRAIARLTHAPDADVRRWARLAESLATDAEALSFVCLAVDCLGNADVVRTSLDWTLGQCRARGCKTVMPFFE